MCARSKSNAQPVWISLLLALVFRCPFWALIFPRLDCAGLCVQIFLRPVTADFPSTPDQSCICGPYNHHVPRMTKFFCRMRMGCLFHGQLVASYCRRLCGGVQRCGQVAQRLAWRPRSTSVTIHRMFSTSNQLSTSVHGVWG